MMGHIAHLRNISIINNSIIIQAHRLNVLIIYPWKRGMILHLNKLDIVREVWIELTQWFWRQRF